jgi:hypothetical protein
MRWLFLLQEIKKTGQPEGETFSQAGEGQEL